MRTTYSLKTLHGSWLARRSAAWVVRGFTAFMIILLAASLLAGCARQDLDDFSRGSRDAAIRHAPDLIDSAAPILSEELGERLGDRLGETVSAAVVAGVKTAIEGLPKSPPTPPPAGPPASDPNLLYHLGTVVTTLGLLWGKGKLDKRGRSS